MEQPTQRPVANSAGNAVRPLPTDPPPPPRCALLGSLLPHPGALIANNRQAMMRRLSCYNNGPKTNLARPTL